MSDWLGRRWDARREAKAIWEREHPMVVPGPRPERGVEGVHATRDLMGHSERFWIWQGRATLFGWVLMAFLAGWSVVAHRYAQAVFLAVFIVVTVVVAWRSATYQTVVAPDGLQIRAPFRNVRLGWNEVASVADPARFSPTGTVMVTTTTGHGLRTDVPDTLRDDFVAYAQRHGMAAPPD